MSEFDKRVGDVMNFDEIWDNDGFLSSCSRVDAEHFYNAGQQANIDAITKQRDSFIKAHHIDMNDVCEHKAKIDELQARVDVYELHIKALKNIHENDFNEESESSYILGNLDGFFECIEADLKGNKDEN